MPKDDLTAVRLDKQAKDTIDKKVESGEYESKSAFIRAAIKNYEGTTQKRVYLYTRPGAPPSAQKSPYLTLSSYTEAERLEQLQKTMLKPTPDVIDFVWEISVELQAVVYTIVQSIQKGDWQIIVEPDDPNLKPEDHPLYKRITELLETMLDRIDFHDWIEEFIVAIAKQGNSVHNVQVNDKHELIELGLIEFKHLTPQRHPLKPWFKFIYSVTLDTDTPDTAEGFVTYNSPPYGFGGGAIHKYHLFPLEYTLKDPELFAQVQKKWLANEPVFHCVHGKYRGKGYEIGESPAAPVINKIVNKAMLEYYAPMIAEKFGNPLLIAEQEVIQIQEPDGTIIHNLPSSEDDKSELETTMSTLADDLLNLKAMGVIVNPVGWKTRVETPGSGIFNFPELLRYLKGEIMLAFLASLSLFDITEAHALAASRTLKSVWDDVVDSFRRKIEKVMNQQIFPFCLKLQGIEPDELDCTVSLSLSPYMVPWADVTEATSLVQAGMITPDEWRERYNLPPLEEEVVGTPPTEEDIDEWLTEELEQPQPPTSEEKEEPLPPQEEAPIPQEAKKP